MPNASQYIFSSNEVDVLREMNAFLANAAISTTTEWSDKAQEEQDF
jgi:hypothetical protein